MNFSEEVDGVLGRAFSVAAEAGHAEISPEHVVLELIVEDETASYLMRCGTDLVAVESRVRDYLAGVEPGEDPEADPRPAPALERIIEAASERAEEEDRDCLMLRDLFYALIDDRESAAAVAILEATREPEVFDDLRAYPWEEE
jgi:ATP-dependent Clp protease ATP-binding subunit ClpA